jgi:hypothetical protein
VISLTGSDPHHQAERARDARTGDPAARVRMREQHRWVDLQVQRAIERGDFDDLPGAGKPIPGLGSEHDPDWWVKKLVERERITGVLPAALQLRKDDAELDDHLDRYAAEREVRREVEDFNARVVAARRQLEGGPPVITATRDVDDEVGRWRERRTARHTGTQASPAPEPPRPRRRWFRR